MQGIGDAPKITIKGHKQDISLSNWHFENFRYVEDINLGFPTIEFALRDNTYKLLREGLFGDEELIVEEFVRDQFKFDKKSFTIKSIGSLGEEPKPMASQVVKLLAIDKNYDSILKNQKSVYFLSSEKKKISDLLKKLLTQVGIVEAENFKLVIEETAPLLDQGFQNLFIPYSRDPMKVMRKLSNYAMTPDGTGAFTFFINRRGLNFVPVSKLFVDIVKDKTPYLRISDIRQTYGISSAKLSTFNAFSNFITGHEKKIMGFNLYEKEYNSIWYKPNAKYIEHSEYIDKPEIVSNVKTMPLPQVANSNAIPFSKDFITGNIKTYYTPLDNPMALKAFGDRLYYSQMFNYVLELNVDLIQTMPDFAIGEMVDVEFFVTDKDSWSALNGGWLLKSFAYTYPGDNVTLKLTRIGIGTLPEQYIKVGE
jgi:hypothetical protein